MKPIETHWKGYRFRSRLEARWAVFMTAAGIRWEYEPEGFDLGELGWYLPDFICLHNPGRGPYVEIKPTRPNSRELEKLVTVCALARGGDGAYGAFIWGAPGNEEWISIHKDGFLDGGENTTDLIGYLSSFLLKGSYQNAVEAARSARFEHGEVPA